MRVPVEARAIHNVSDIVDKERPEPFPVRRIILEISVLDDQNVSSGGTESSSQGGALPAITLVKYRTDSGCRHAGYRIVDAHPSCSIEGGYLNFVAYRMLQPCGGSISRTIINHYYFLLDVWYCRNNPI
jgi:hypothetical protein